jgi:hypothetical protein
MPTSRAPGCLVRSEGPELRALRALLTELDPNRTFNGMYVVAIPSGDRPRQLACLHRFRGGNPATSAQRQLRVTRSAQWETPQ